MASLRTRFSNRQRTPWTLARNFLLAVVGLSIIYALAPFLGN